jgi:hypothetical protein
VSALSRVAVIVALAGCAVVATPLPAARGDGCGTLPSQVGCGASADPAAGYFHGVIGVTGQGWVLATSSHAGTRPGCGDCVWTVTLDCPQVSPGDPDYAPACSGLRAGSGCPEGELPFNLYLSTAAVTDELVGRVCLGGSSQIVEVGSDAEADVARYLGAITPPDLLLTRRPHGPTLTGLPTYFTATPPRDGLGPEAFGGPTVREAITVTPRRMAWQWGDGESSDWLAVGATVTHRYLAAGTVTVTLTTEWSATYVASFDGQTVGPFDATGVIDRDQTSVERIDSSRPVLVRSSP